MNACAQITDRLASLIPLTPEDLVHADVCRECRALIRAHTLGPQEVAPQMSAALQEALRSTTPVKPISPARMLLPWAAVCGVGLWMGAGGAPLPHPAAGAGVFAVLAGLLLSALMHRTPSGLELRPSHLLVAQVVVFGVYQLVNLTLLGHGEAAEPVAAGVTCLGFALTWSVIPGAAAVFAVRRTAVLAPVLTAAAAGMVGGMGGVLALYLKCPASDVMHLVIFHALVLPLCAVLGALLGRRVVVV